MAAPMKVPEHHIRQELCLSRPAYREGRHPKAIKVYTINQESVYLLVQGVPALGVAQELVKLFAVHGPVEEYRVLDQYPSADQFTDVYLIKFSKIQSARFAKKKLDDWSFLGGVLHVSYAPEFESVEETRQKLIDRRKVVASRIRLHEREDEKRSQAIDKSLSSVTSSELSKAECSHTEPQTQRIENNTETLPNSRHENGSNETDSINPGISNMNVAPSLRGNEIPRLFVPAPPSTWIPTPPKHNPNFSNFDDHRHRKQDYPYAKVPSAHATLPRVQVHLSETEMLQSMDSGIHGNSVESIRDPTRSHSSKPDKNEEKSNLQSTSKTNVSDSKNGSKSQSKRGEEGDTAMVKTKEKIVNGLIVRDYKASTKKSTPKFIPRQTLNLLKKKPSGSEVEKKGTESEVDTELKRNAFILGKPQGPGCTGESKSEVTEGEKSVERTRMEIRKRVSQTIGDPPKKQRKSPP